MRPAAPGAPLLDYLTSSWYNKTLLTQRIVEQGQRPRFEQQHDHIRCVLDEVSPNEIGWLEPAVLTDSYITPGTDPTDPSKSSIVAKVKKPAAGAVSPWGIMQGPVYAGMPETIAVAGVTWAKFTRSNAAHKYLDLDSTSLTLKSQDSAGPARILSFTATSGDGGYGLILLGSPASSNSAIFKTDEDIPAINNLTPGSGQASQFDFSGDDLTVGSTETVYNVGPAIPTGTFVIGFKIQDHWTILDTRTNFTFFQLHAGSSLTGVFGETTSAYKNWDGSGDLISVVNASFYAPPLARGMAVEQGNFWQIIWIEQPASRVLVKLTDNPNSSPGNPLYGCDPRDPDDLAYFLTASPAPEALSQFPNNMIAGLSSGQCSNDYLLTGEAGDYAILEWRPDTTEYVVVQIIEQRPQSMFINFAADRPNGLAQTVSANFDTPIGGGYIANPFNVKDAFNVAINAKSALPAHRALVQWDRRNQQYVIIASEHQCTKFRGTLYASFSGTPLTFQVTPVYGFDGPLPTGRVTVRNIFKWDSGTVGKEITVEWDTVNGYWIPAQMEWSCP